MEKISSILPSSPRVSTVDLASGPTLRPGTPSFGSPMGSTAAQDRITFSNAATAIAGSPEIENWKTKEDRLAKIAENVSAGFFRTTKPNAPASPVDLSAEMGAPAVSASASSGVGMGAVVASGGLSASGSGGLSADVSARAGASASASHEPRTLADVHAAFEARQRSGGVSIRA